MVKSLVIIIHPLDTMDTCNKFNGYPFNGCSDISPKPQGAVAIDPTEKNLQILWQGYVLFRKKNSINNVE